MVRATALAATAGESSAASASQLVAEGRRSAARLHALLCRQQAAAGSSSSTLHGCPMALTEQILCCFDRAIAALHGGAGAGCREDDDGHAAVRGGKCKPERGSAGARAAASSKRIRVEKKATMHDNFLWRKYGQKEIKNSKHPRLYYRCSYRDDHGCTATKQVQQSEDDDTASPVYVITYFGEHFCGRVADVGGPVVAGDDGEESEELMVISFGSSAAAAAAATGGASAAYPWPCCGEDAKNRGPSKTWSLPDWEEVPPLTANVAEELIEEESTPEPELMGLISSPDLEYSLLDLELGESSFGIDGFINFDELSVYSIDNAR
uniref:WRKY domain-containing protein n=1 Tax=Oryza glumipatula TaxID=40148 RepID=A0A0E0A0P9_9ORYZ